MKEGWLEEDWTITMPHLLNELLRKNFTSKRNPTSTHVPHVTEGIQWIRMEELGKALTNRYVERYENCQTKHRKISQGSEIEIPIVNSLNSNANFKRPHGVAFMNSSI